VEAGQPAEKQKESAGPQKQRAKKNPGESVQAKVMYNNEMDAMFVAFTVGHHIVRGLSSSASEEETFSVITNETNEIK
jgi:hypothetical protein